MISGPPFPIAIDELDADLLSQALGAEVASFESTRIGANRGMLGEVFRLDISYAPGGTGPASVVAKFAALRDGSLESAKVGGTHERELRAYDELLPTTEVSVPAMHAAYYDPGTAHFLLVQDVVDVDGSVDQLTGIDVARARAVLAQVARLHARWWGDDTLRSATWLPRLDGTGRRRNLTAMVRAGWAPLCEIAEFDEGQVAFGEGLAERVEQALVDLARLPSTLLHCDLRTDNLLFAPGASTVTIVDWQGAGVGPPSFDLAYFLSQCLTVEDRRRHEQELIDFYRRELAAAGLELTEGQIRIGYRESMLYGLAIACAIPVVSDRSEPRSRQLAATMARRALAAFDDQCTGTDEEEQ